MAINKTSFINAIKMGLQPNKFSIELDKTDAYTRDTLKRGDELIAAAKAQRARQQARNAVKAKAQQTAYDKKYENADFVKPVK